MLPTTASAERPGRARLAAFAAPSLPISALGLPLVVFLPEFYASRVGLELALVGTVFMVIRLVDIAFDPVLGALMDRGRSSWGSFRPWLAGGTPLLMFGIYLAFSPPAGAGPLYLALALLALHIPYSLCHISHMSWAARLSTDYDQRSRIYGWWQAGNMLGIILILLLPAFIASRGGAPGSVVPAMGWFLIILLPVTVALAVTVVPDQAPATRSAADWHGAWRLLRRADVRRLLTADLAFGLAPGLAGATFVFFFREVKELSQLQASLLLLTNFAAAFAGAPLWGWMARRIGKHRALAAAGVLYAVFQVSLYFATPGSLTMAAPLFAVVGLAFSAPQMLLRAMMADAGDAERLESGVDRTAMLYALVTAVSKLGYALSVGVAFGALSLVGFEANPEAANGGSAIWGLQFIYLAVPAALMLTGATLIYGFPIDRERHAAIRSALGAG